MGSLERALEHYSASASAGNDVAALNLAVVLELEGRTGESEAVRSVCLPRDPLAFNLAGRPRARGGAPGKPSGESRAVVGLCALVPQEKKHNKSS